MNFRNPTHIQIGRTGTYGGHTWRAVGRVVLGVVEDGDTYYWNEFNLVTGTGETATLVFERTERGSEWRWFTEFEPEYPMTAADAATKEVGDLLNLDGTDVKVTLLEQSRIYFVEGEAPAGEQVGSEASYFNAENGREMLVVSWTGDQVEYYRGRTITNREVREAFHLNVVEHATVPAGATTRHNRFEPSPYSGWGTAAKVVMGACILIVVLFVLKDVFRSSSRSAATTRITRFSAPPAALKVGATGRLSALNYRVTGHALLAVAEEDLRFSQQVYFLRDDLNNEALLIAGFVPGDNGWVLFTPLNPMYPLTPYKAAAVKLGQVVTVDRMVAPVDELFTKTVQESEFADTPELVTGETYFGFAGKRDSQFLLASWNAETISFWKGLSLSQQTVLAGLGPATPVK